MTEGEQREEKQEGGCPPCVDSFINEICDLLPEPHSGKCRQLTKDLAGGKIGPAEFAAEGWKIPGLAEAFGKYLNSTKSIRGTH